MRLRKQAKDGPLPGDEFLRAVSSGRGRARPAVPPPAAGDPGLRQQILETDRRAAAAEESLRQIREESRHRLEEARSALEREREARFAAERELDLALQRPPQHEPEPDVAEPIEPDPAPDEAERGAGFKGSGDEPPVHPDHPTEDDEEVPEWPTPWLGAKGRRRGIFRRSPS